MLRRATIGVLAAFLVWGSGAAPFAHAHPSSHAHGQPTSDHRHGHDAGKHRGPVHWHLAGQDTADRFAPAWRVDAAPTDAVRLISVAVERAGVRGDNTPSIVPAIDTPPPVLSNRAIVFAPEARPNPPPHLTLPARAPPR